MGTLMTNVLICLVGCFGKVGYFPSLIITMLVLYCSSYLLVMYDQIIKRGYLFCFLVINGIAISPNSWIHLSPGLLSMIGSIFYLTTGLHGLHVLIGCFGFFGILFSLLFLNYLYCIILTALFQYLHPPQ